MFCVAFFALLAARSSSSISAVLNWKVQAARLSRTCSGDFIPTITSAPLLIAHAIATADILTCRTYSQNPDPSRTCLKPPMGNRCTEISSISDLVNISRRLRIIHLLPFAFNFAEFARVPRVKRASAISRSVPRSGRKLGSNARNKSPRGPLGNRLSLYLPATRRCGDDRHYTGHENR